MTDLYDRPAAPSAEKLAQAVAAVEALSTAIDRKGGAPSPDDIRRLEAGVEGVRQLKDAVRREETAAAKLFLASLGGDASGASSYGQKAGPNQLFDAEQGAMIVAAVKSRTPFRTELDAKAPAFSSILPTAGTYVAPGQYPTAFALAQLFQQVQAQGPSVRYYTFNTATAAVVAEGALKPDAGVAVTPVDVTIQKIATTAKFSDEFAEDAGFLLTYLGAELSSAVVVRENASILAAFAATAGIQTATGTKALALDVYAGAIAASESANGSTPTVLVTNPADLAIIRQAKASTGGSYIVDPLVAGPASVHGVRLVSSAVTPAGTAWLVNAAGVQIYRRGNLTVDIGWTDDDFQRNQRTIRAEERFAPAVVRPSMLTKITLT